MQQFLYGTTVTNKRSAKYDKPLQLKEGVELDDLIGVALRTPPEQAVSKVKPTKAAKKKTKR